MTANALTALITVPLVFLLPRLIVSGKGSEIHEEVLVLGADPGS